MCVIQILIILAIIFLIIHLIQVKKCQDMIMMKMPPCAQQQDKINMMMWIDSRNMCLNLIFLDLVVLLVLLYLCKLKNKFNML